MVRETDGSSNADATGPDDASTAAGVAPQIEAGDLGEITILFVDDERQLLSILASKLKEELGSIEVVTASNGTEALERLEQLEIDCVVSDYKMPGMNGLEILKKARERDPDLPFILFTSKGSEDIATEAINANVTDYLQKNLGEKQFALLANRIENAVSQYRATQTARDTYQHVKRIHDRISDAYLGMDDEWNIIYVDEDASGLLQDSREDLVGKNFWDVLPQAVGSPFESEFKRALETQEPVAFETRYEPFDTHFEVRAFPSEDGLSIYFRDITGLKEREEAIERYQERLDAIGSHVDDLQGALDDETPTEVARLVDEIDELVSDRPDGLPP